MDPDHHLALRYFQKGSFQTGITKMIRVFLGTTGMNGLGFFLRGNGVLLILHGCLDTYIDYKSCVCNIEGARNSTCY